MCGACTHWRKREAFDYYGERFATCVLKPDLVVKDRRCYGGVDRQEFVTSATYVCAKFDKDTP